jgi:translation initiation factor IF-3
LKELRLRPYISDHDLQRKVAWVRRALELGERVKVTVRLRGRENARPECGQKLIGRIVTTLSDVATTGTPSKRGTDILLIPVAGK